MSQDSSTVRLTTWLREEIRGSRPGDRLPSTRALVDTHRVSPVTVSRVLAALGAEGLVVSRPGAGTFVAPPPRPGRPADYSWQTITLGDRIVDTAGLSPLADPPHEDGVISLATGYLHPSLMPVRALSAALSRAARLPDAWDRPPVAGLHGLRSWFARAASPDADAGDVVVTAGGQGAITAAFRALVPAGGRLLVESPTYPGALAVARAAGLRPVPVPADAFGVIPDLLADAFARSGALAFYCQPAYHNPAGTVLAGPRREAVLAAAAAAGAFVIEDDCCRWLAHGQRPPPTLLAADQEGRVVYLTSLTKAASPSLRVGALIARGPVAARLRALRVVDDMFVARPVQEAALELVSGPAWDRHLRGLGQALTGRARALVSALARHAPGVSFTAPAGGMHLWARLPAGLDDAEAAQAARRSGVAVMPGRPFFPAEPPGPYLRLTFSAAPASADLDAAVRRLAAAVPELARPAAC
ncbi:MAG: PLP-dependent aminotransferase family protein [Streptosporangiaceae bacterium]